MSDLICREDVYAAIRGLTRHIDRIAAITALPAVQPDAREAALREALEAVNAKWRSGAADTPDEMRGLALAEAAIFDLIDKPGKEVMPDVSNDPAHQPDAAPASTNDAGRGVWMEAMQASNLRLSGALYDMTAERDRLQAKIRFLERRALD